MTGLMQEWVFRWTLSLEQSDTSWEWLQVHVPFVIMQLLVYRWECYLSALSLIQIVQSLLSLSDRTIYRCTLFLGGLSLHLNHLIGSRVRNYDWPFGTLPFGLFGSNLDTMDLETYPRTSSGHFWHVTFWRFQGSLSIFQKWVLSENQSFLDEGSIA